MQPDASFSAHFPILIDSVVFALINSCLAKALPPFSFVDQFDFYFLAVLMTSYFGIGILQRDLQRTKANYKVPMI